MQKRRLKFNIIDVAILVVLVCSVCSLIFRDNIVEIFGTPEIESVEIKVCAENNGNLSESLISGAVMELHFGNNMKAQAVVSSTEVSDDGKIYVKASLNGYKRLGRFYSENGNPFEIGNEYLADFNGGKIAFVLENVGISGENAA